MATSSQFSTSNQYIKYWFDVTTNSQNVNNNTSNITVKVKIKRTNSGYTTYGTGTVKTTINGKSFSASISPSDKITSTERTLCSYTLDISHNSDGTKRVDMSANITHQQFNSSGTGSYSLTLKTIPRTSSFSLSSSSVNAGSSVKISISRNSSSFKHNVYLKVGSTTYTKKTGIDTSLDYTIDNSVMNKITSSTSGTGTIYVETMNGSTKVGTATKNITINIPSNITPSFTFNISRNDNGVPSSWNTYIQGKSKVNASITGASSPYGASIASYNISGGGYSSSSTSFTTGTINTSGSVKFTATIKDSRGRTSTQTKTINVVSYSNPTINLLSVGRVIYDNWSNQYVDSDNGNTLAVKLTASYSSVGSNYLSASVKYRQEGDSWWSSDTNLTTNGSAVYVGNGSISPDHSYEISVTIWDQLNSISKVIKINTASTVLDFKNGGTGIAIGKVSEKDGLEIAWPTYFNQLANFNDKIKITGSGASIEVGASGSDIFIRNTTSNKYLTLNNNGKLIYDNRNVILEAQSSPLWQGYHHMVKSETVTPSKKLSDCQNGWCVVWSDWNDGGKGENFNFVYTYIPKNTPWKSGQNHTFGMSTGEGDDTYANKTLYVYNDKLTGHDSNKKGKAYDVVIRAVLEY